jgi:hypothetical protein
MGRFASPLPKTNTVGFDANAATGIMKREVAPDSPQSMGSAAAFKVSVPSTVQQSLSGDTFAPKAMIARRVASVSSEHSGPEILDLPLASAEAMSMRCV